MYDGTSTNELRELLRALFAEHQITNAPSATFLAYGSRAVLNEALALAFTIAHR